MATNGTDKEAPTPAAAAKDYAREHPDESGPIEIVSDAPHGRGVKQYSYFEFARGRVWEAIRFSLSGQPITKTIDIRSKPEEQQPGA